MIPVDVTDEPFQMGDETGDLWKACRPVHPVRLTRRFYLGEYPVTQALWAAVMDDESTPAYFSGTRRPVEHVSWADAKDFLEKLCRLTGQPFRLPTEAEWEYAARGGAYNTGCPYAGSKRLKEVGWFETNSHGETKPAGGKGPNELGLYDMSGNVWEWCSDWFEENYYQSSPAADPPGPDEGSGRVLRGGGWSGTPLHCRVANRSHWYPDYGDVNLGFRLAVSLQ